MKNSIYEIYVPVTSQQQADRLKAICVEYGLPIWTAEIAFDYDKSLGDFFIYNGRDKGFGIYGGYLNKTPITESEFLELAKEFKQ
jgi:hypothetical protein